MKLLKVFAGLFLALSLVLCLNVLILNHVLEPMTEWLKTKVKFEEPNGAWCLIALFPVIFNGVVILLYGIVGIIGFDGIYGRDGEPKEYGFHRMFCTVVKQWATHLPVSAYWLLMVYLITITPGKEGLYQLLVFIEVMAMAAGLIVGIVANMNFENPSMGMLNLNYKIFHYYDLKASKLRRDTELANNIQKFLSTQTI